MYIVTGFNIRQVSDARAALAWLTAKLGEQARVVVWGHSLGSAVAAHMVADFDLETGGTRYNIRHKIPTNTENLSQII